MTPELEKFITLATRTLEGRETHREEARSELMGRLSHQGVPLESLDVAGPTARLEAAKAFPVNLRRGLVLGALLLLFGVFLLGLWRDGWMLYRSIISQQLSWQARYAGSFPGSGQHDRFHGWLDRKAPEMPIRGRSGEIENLRREHPEDLAILQEALMRRSTGENEFITPEEREQIARLDARNALWPMLEMVWESHKAVGMEPFGRFFFSSSRSGDPAARERAWQRFGEAVELDEFRSYGGELVRRQCEAYGPDATVLDGMILGNLAELPSSAIGTGRFYYGAGYSAFSAEVAARAGELATAGSEAPFRKLYEDWKQLLQMVAWSETPDLAMLGIFTDELGEATKAFEPGFTRFGMKHHADEAREIGRRLAPRSPALARRSRAEAGMRMQQGVRIEPLPATAEEMRPGRKADMAMFHRMLTWPLAALALLFVLMWGFEACRRSPEVKGLARGLMPLLTRRDHLCIAVFGIAAPWIYWWGITRLTPVGISDRIFGNDEWIALAWVLQIAIGMVLGLVMLTQSARGRWARRGGFLGLAGGMDWLGWAVAGLVALSLPAAGLLGVLDLANDDHKAYYLLACAAAGSVGLLWLLWVGIMNLCTSRHGALGPNLIARAVIPWSLAGLATLLLAAAVLRFAEVWWYARDPLLPTSTSRHYVNALEERVGMERVERLREVFRE